MNTSVNLAPSFVPAVAHGVGVFVHQGAFSRSSRSR